MNPVNLLSLRSSVCRFFSCEKVSGISPVRSLLVNEITRRFRRKPISDGIVPETLPGKRTSCVNWVKNAMELERDPSIPGESDLPVPRVRVETRSVYGELGSKEHVTPENEVQGSEAVKSQVEKKFVGAPGASLSVALMVRRAERSVRLRVGGGGGRECAVAERISRSGKREIFIGNGRLLVIAF
ncbi:unnamed protein product [Rhodiola kirilowii]